MANSMEGLFPVMKRHAFVPIMYSISLGNGKIDKFWTDHWLNGKDPREMTPSIFNIYAEAKTF
jgi:hypothetical protein